MKFRHFFRHAYRVDIDPARLERNLSNALRLATPIAAALDGFEAFVGASLERLAER